MAKGRPKGSGSPGSLASVRSAIRGAGLRWQAAETSVADLSVAEQKGRLGLAVDEAELAATARAVQAAQELRAFEAEVSAPAAVDWRNKNGNWVTGVKDQQSCGSCVSFGTLATAESHIRLACRNANLAVDLSEAHLFYCGCGNCCATGWNFAPALDFCKNTGMALESAFPYTPGDQPCPPSVTIHARLTGWQKVLAVQDRKAYLAEKGPMVGGMAVYSDFFRYSSGVYAHTPSATLRGYHAISVIGYDDGDGCWICKNSWGPNWGDGGFFRIAYGDSMMDTSFAFYGMTVSCPVPQTVCRRYVPFLLKVATAARRDRYLGACLRYYVCRRGARPRCSAATLRVVRLVMSVLRRCPQYRAPLCRLVP